MESIEMTTFQRPHEPRSKVLFNEVLCDLSKNRFRKLQVKVSKFISEEAVGSAFLMEIVGLGHKFHLKFTFSAKDLCFLRREERSENIEHSCLRCLDWNIYNNAACTWLTLIWRLEDQGQHIKVPFIQWGNRQAATTLQKLESTVYKHVAKPEALLHWQVYVKRCGSLSESEPLFLSLTGFALVIVHNYEIIYHHPLLTTQFTTKCTPELNLIEIDVEDKAWITGDQETQNFTLTRKYVFSTVHGQDIERELKSLQRQSLNKLGSPSIHFNILHCEQSATDFIPGTTSDNVVIPHHRHRYQVNTSSGSSGSNGHIPNTHISSNRNVIVHVSPKNDSPTPCVISSSNGHIPRCAGPPDTLHKMDRRPHFELPDISGGESDSTGEGGFIARGPNMGGTDTIQLDWLQSQTHPKILVRARSNKSRPPGSEVHLPPSLPGTYLHERLTFESSPIPVGPEEQHFLTSQNDNNGLTAGSLDDIETCVHSTDVDVSLLPPPTPCGGRSNPVAFISCWSFTDDTSATDIKHIHEGAHEIRPPLPRRLLRSQSVNLLTESELPVHVYVNTEQQSVQLSSMHDDSPYYRFYYNCGFIRMTAATMSTKIKRRQRLSKDMGNFDSNLLNKHEKWFDNCFKTRDKDLRFCRLSRMNIEPQEHTDETLTASGYATTTPIRPIRPTLDDPYWNGDLCVTLQAKLERRSPSVREAFDISQGQLIGIRVLLSLVPSERNWKNLAEYIGLVSGDIALIEHFCYTYRELAAEVVLTHWLMQCQRQKSNVACTRENLLHFLDEMERSDIRNVLLTTSDNVTVQTRGEMDDITNEFATTHL